MASRTTLAHRPELDRFLFANVGPERNGMMLTVVSALARLGLDAWKEADRFSAMPKDMAALKLAPLLRRLPEGLWKVSEVQSIAARLVSLLPVASEAVVPVRRGKGSVISWLVCGTLIAAVALAMGSGRELSLGRFFGSSPQANFGTDDAQPRDR